jgi:hypothetical protein
VLLDLVVRDGKQRLIKNLTPADIEVYEDGVRQEIKSFARRDEKGLSEVPAVRSGTPAAAQAPTP